ncbi:MAG: transcription-repair coupling factor, partial [Woeseiaceae bacterium]|nr:transcription-repair coupling factor [Woeseiaceae bacterium]
MAALPTLIAPNASVPGPGRVPSWGRLIGASTALLAAEYARAVDAPVLLLAEDARGADRLEAECRFFAGSAIDVLHFVEWETLPWDSFSPHQDIVSQRLAALARLPSLRTGIVIASAQALLQRLPPTDYVAARSLSLTTGQTLERDAFVDTLTGSGYYRVPQVAEHGEFAVRGSLIDVFPMGAEAPVRIDLFDDEIESLRTFAPDTQLSGDSLETFELLPAREIPLDADDIRRFRDRYRERFEGQPGKSRIYREVSDGIA